MVAIVVHIVGNNDETAFVQLENCTMEQIPREFLPADIKVGDKVKIIVDLGGIKTWKVQHLTNNIRPKG